MVIDAKRIERELARILRSHGISLTGFHGDLYVGACSTKESESGVDVPTMPARSVAISLSKLSRDLADAIQ